MCNGRNATRANPRRRNERRGSHMDVRLLKVLHSFGKVPVKEFALSHLSMDAAKKKNHKGKRT